MDKEADYILPPVRKYVDELFIDALKDAPPTKVLEPLKELRAIIGEEYAEYKDLTSTIDVLEQKMRKMDEQENISNLAEAGAVALAVESEFGVGDTADLPKHGGTCWPW